MKKLHYLSIAMSLTAVFLGMSLGQACALPRYGLSADSTSVNRSLPAPNTGVETADVAPTSSSHPGILNTVSPRTRETLVFHFSLGKSVLQVDYRQNELQFERLDAFLAPENLSSIDRIVITGNASLEGPADNNLKLSMTRASETRKVIRWKYPEVHDDFGIPIELHAVFPDDSLEHLRQIIYAHPKLLCREKLLDILNTQASPTEKMERISQECGSTTYQYIISKFFRELRNATVYILYKGDPGYGFPWNPEPVAEPVTDTASLNAQPQIAADILTGTSDTAEDSSVMHLPSIDSTVVEIPVTPLLSAQRPDPKRAAIAVKTNLLFDAFTAINAEIEIPLGKRWSISAGAVFPQWNFSNRHCMTITEVSLEPRLWLGNRDRLRSGKLRNSLTGHFIGLYGNYVDNYDLQWEYRGVMGTGYGVGLTYGYSHRLGRSFNMEYSIGVGALYLENKSYDVSDDYSYKVLRKEHSGWNILPTRAKISLVWLIGNKENRK